MKIIKSTIEEKGITYLLKIILTENEAFFYRSRLIELGFNENPNGEFVFFSSNEKEIDDKIDYIKKEQEKLKDHILAVDALKSIAFSKIKELQNTIDKLKEEIETIKRALDKKGIKLYSFPIFDALWDFKVPILFVFISVILILILGISSFVKNQKIEYLRNEIKYLENRTTEALAKKESLEIAINELDKKIKEYEEKNSQLQKIIRIFKKGESLYVETTLTKEYSKILYEKEMLQQELKRLMILNDSLIKEKTKTIAETIIKEKKIKAPKFGFQVFATNPFDKISLEIGLGFKIDKFLVFGTKRRAGIGIQIP
ncbi:MAG: hypothetical protein QXI58_00730 [Candidatus Micrarchaeia archaeon]